MTTTPPEPAPDATPTDNDTDAFKSAPQIESETTVVAPANGGDRNRTADEASQPAALVRPLEESARLANQRTEDKVLGQDYEVSRERGYRKA